MKHLIITIAAAFVCISASAQTFDFSSNKDRYEVGLTFGSAGHTTPRQEYSLGANVLAWGVYFHMIKGGPQHRFDNSVKDVQWNDTVALNLDLGYQIPILNWLRVMPILGYCQTNEGITDGSQLKVSFDSDGADSIYHPYKVTPGTREHYFNFGGGFSIQPCKWFSINAVYSRYAVYGGFSLNLTAFANR